MGGGGSDAAVEYVVETIVAELEANEEIEEEEHEEEEEEVVMVEEEEGEGRGGPAVSGQGGGGGGICGPEDVFSVLQASVECSLDSTIERMHLLST